MTHSSICFPLSPFSTVLKIIIRIRSGHRDYDLKNINWVKNNIKVRKYFAIGPQVQGCFFFLKN